MMHPLSQYKNLADWAIRAHGDEDKPTLASQKDAALAELNGKLGTHYERKHIDNWLAGRKGIPATVFAFWFDMLIEVEVQFDHEELGLELRRLFKK